MKTAIIYSVIVALSFFSCTEKDSQNQTEILWDKWGVPHVYAADEAEMYHAFGWVL